MATAAHSEEELQQLAMYKLSQQQAMAPKPGTSMQLGSGLFGGNFANWNNMYSDFPPAVINPIKKIIKFFRINEAVHEGMELEPLDELRIKVAKWLKR